MASIKIEWHLSVHELVVNTCTIPCEYNNRMSIIMRSILIVNKMQSQQKLFTLRLFLSLDDLLRELVPIATRDSLSVRFNNIYIH